LEVTVEHEFKAAAELMTGSATRQPVSFAPVLEAELVPVPVPQTLTQPQP
jgi:hypothetical protein